MHYYQHHIGDYRRDTTHFSMLEHGAYRQLLDWLYLDQKPIPMETEVVFRRLRAITDDEKLAVETVLKEKFELTDQGYIQHRVLEEIEAYKKKADIAKENGKSGGRPKKTNPVISGMLNETQEKANHKPLTNNHKPIDIEDLPSAKDVIDHLNAKSGSAFRHVDSNLKLILARLKEGATVDECKQVIDRKCLDWLQDAKMKDYLRPATLFNATNFASYVGQLSKSQVPPPKPINPNFLGVK